MNVFVIDNSVILLTQFNYRFSVSAKQNRCISFFKPLTKEDINKSNHLSIIYTKFTLRTDQTFINRAYWDRSGSPAFCFHHFLFHRLLLYFLWDDLAQLFCVLLIN